MADINIMVSTELDTEPKNSKEVKSHFGAMTANVDVHIFTVPKKEIQTKSVMVCHSVPCGSRSK